MTLLTPTPLTDAEKFRLDEAIAETREKVEGALDDILPVPNEEDDESRLFEAMRYAVFAGGKRLRPLLVLAVNDMLGGAEIEDRAVRIAAAVEMLHTYSLVHDDLPCMDDDDLRRGQPTCHKQFDEATAVLAGDALLTQSFEVLARSATHPDGNVRAELVRLLSTAAGPYGMVGGQMLDIMAEEMEDADVVFEQGELARLQRKKTGAMFQVCCEMACLINYASKDHTQRLISYARNLGLAFQMIDDVLDVTGTTEQLGKTPGKDAAQNKPTFATLLGVDGATQQAVLLAEQAQAQLTVFGPAADTLRLLARFVIARSY